MIKKRISIKIGNARLLKLAAYLETVPRKRFDFTRWLDEDATATSCGTRACAMGHAAMMPMFRRLGLRIVPCLSHPDARRLKLDGETNAIFIAARLFGISGYEAERLFTCGYRATPKQVAKNMRDFVAGRSK